ncbi:MAG: 4-coumarate--CoA ligase [Cycloclasticus sp.]|nr:MAG: 4-coumarate--CoA ligase [Cycloclasticus sp.]
MKVNVYGSSLSAWVAAASLAKVGNDVCINEMGAGSIKELNEIGVIRDELGLLNLLEQQIDSGRLVRCSKLENLADIHWFTLQATEQDLAEQILDKICIINPNGLLVINQCNFTVGATVGLQARIGEENDVVYIPDNLQEGAALKGFNRPKRITLGMDDTRVLIQVKALLRPFSTELDELQIMSSREAEFTKFAITGMLAVRLGYINELANLADQLDVDISVVQGGMGADPRIGRHYLSPGCGFGGQNFHAYVEKFASIFQTEQQQTLLKTVILQNETQKELPFRKLWQHYHGDLSDKVIAIWGASFKPGTASIDNAPSIKNIDALISQNVQVRVHDPEAIDNLRAYYKDQPLVSYYDDHMAAIKDVDGLLLLTEWPLYWSPDYDKLVGAMRHPLLVDGRNILDKEMLSQYGLIYIGVGR